MHTLDNSPKAIAYFDDVARPDGGVEDYFTGRGERPGRWVGSGLANVGLTLGDEVAQEAAHRLLFNGEHPLTAEPLGQRMRRGDGIAGFGMTFSAPKSVSLLWALGSNQVARKVEAAEAAAVDAGLAYLERHCVYARRGRNGLEQIDGDGLIAGAYAHRTSRDCDPQLHTHVLVANRTLCEDGRWRTLDSREILGRPENLKGAGAVYQLALRAELTRTLGVTWGPVSEHGQADIDGVPRSLIDDFSKRSADVRVAAAAFAAEMVARDRDRLDRPPTQRELQQAAYDTRRRKVVVDSERIHDVWAAEAAEIGWDRRKLEMATLDRAPKRAPEIPDEAEITRAAVVDMTDRESVFRPGHAALSVARRLQVRSSAEAVERVEELTARVFASPEVVALSGPELGHAGFPTRASDGRSTVTRAGDRVYSVDAVLAQEIRLAEVAERGTRARAAIVPSDIVGWAMSAHDDAFPERPLGVDQREAVAILTGDGQRVSILVGPAGTGKSVTLGVARAAWEASGYRVRGYAPFGAAAASLQQSASIETEVVAKLLYEQRRLERLQPADRERWEITDRDVVLVDEAGTVGTSDLHALVMAVEAARAKLVLAGDRRQLASVVRGGMFAELHRRLGGPELTEVHRLAHAWERDAAMAIRRRDPDGLDAYASHRRIRSGGNEAMLESAYQFWAEGHLGGHDTLVVAHRNEVVDELNRRAQQLLVTLGHIEAGGVAIAGEAVANIGDLIVTRHPDRQIRVSGPTGYVRNGARWRVTDVSDDGALVAEELAASPGTPPGRTRLPAAYAREYVRLGYAGTGHSSQGKTVDRVAVYIDGSEDANWLYSALTRARQGAALFVATEATELAAEFGKAPPTPRQVLERVVTRDGEKLAAVAELAAAQERSEQVASLELLATADRPTAELASERRQLQRQLLLANTPSRLHAARASVHRAEGLVAQAASEFTAAVTNVRKVGEAPRWRRSRHDLLAAQDAVAVAAERKEAAEGALREAEHGLAAVQAEQDSIGPCRDRLELVEAALGEQVRAAVRSPAPYLTTALGRRPERGTAGREEWDERAMRMETYRHVELGLDPDDGYLGRTGVEAAVGPCPEGYVERLQWDHAVGSRAQELQLARELEGLGIDL